MTLDPKAFDAAREAWIASDVATRFFSDVEHCALEAAIVAYLSTVTPAEVGAQTEARAIARLRETLGGIYPVDFRGDNLAVFLASELEPQIEDETLDESGTWKQGAIDACNRILDAIHAHYATALAAKGAELAAERAALRLAADRADRAEAQLAEARKVLVIANAHLDNMEFLSVEGFMDWQQEYRAARRAREQGGELDGRD